jgi:hypothetical protein
MNNTLPRVRAGQPVADDGSCWRHLAERQQAHYTAETFNASCPPLNHTCSAHLVGESEDPQPGRYWVQRPPSVAPRWLLFVAGVMCGAVACAWVMLP